MKKALEDKYNSLMNNETWELIPPSKDSNIIIGSKWVFKLKLDANGSIVRKYFLQLQGTHA